MRTAIGIAAALAIGCTKEASTPAHRVELRRTGGSTFELIPSPGQAEHCLAYTVNKDGLIRQLTMSRLNRAYDCPAGRPIGRHSFRVPLAEGPVKIYVLFTSAEVNAGSVAEQLVESADRQKLNIMNLRLPGVATLDTLEFAPEEDVAPHLGEVVAPKGAAPPSESADAGS